MSILWILQQIQLLLITLARGLLQVGRGLLAAGADFAGGLLGPSVGAAGHKTWETTKPGIFKSHKCNNCGKEFAP